MALIEITGVVERVSGANGSFVRIFEDENSPTAAKKQDGTGIRSYWQGFTANNEPFEFAEGTLVTIRGEVAFARTEEYQGNTVVRQNLQNIVAEAADSTEDAPF